MNKFLLSEMNGLDVSRALKEEKVDKVIAIFGSIENHGYHLPYGNDMYSPYETAKLIAKRIGKTIVLPPIPFGVTLQHTNFPMTISLYPETLERLIWDIFNGIVENGIKKILVVNEHDGNIASIQSVARRLKKLDSDIAIAIFEGWWTPIYQNLRKDIFEVHDGWGHAGEGETSIALHYYPQLVQMKNAKGSGIPDLPKSLWLNFNIDEATDIGAFSDPTKASAEKGKRIIEACVDEVVAEIEKLEEDGWKIKKARLL